MVFNKI